MSYTSLLINTCTIQRFTDGAADAYGNPARTWADHLVDEPCRQIYGKGTEVKVGAEVVIIYDELFLENVDVKVWDRAVIGGVTYNIVSVVQRQDSSAQHHKHCFLQRVDNG